MCACLCVIEYVVHERNHLSAFPLKPSGSGKVASSYCLYFSYILMDPPTIFFVIVYISKIIDLIFTRIQYVHVLKTVERVLCGFGVGGYAYGINHVPFLTTSCS